MINTVLSRSLISASLAIATLAVVVPLSTAQKAEPMVKVASCAVAEVAAHRGNWDDKYEENSRNGFRHTQNKYAAAWWETDVDVVNGTFVIRHDPSQPVRMNFDQFLNDMSVDGVQAFVELKFVPTDAQWNDLIGMINSYAVRSNIVLTSFDGPTLLAAEAKAPTMRRGLIESTGYTTAANITKYHVQYYAKHSDSITYARAQEWTGAGLKLAAWSDNLSDNPAEWKRMNDDKVVSVITDTGGSYVSWAASQGCSLSKR